LFFPLVFYSKVILLIKIHVFLRTKINTLIRK